MANRKRPGDAYVLDAKARSEQATEEVAALAERLTGKPHGPLTYRQRDLAAAMRAALQTGFPVKEIYIDREGFIHILAGTMPAAPAEEESQNPEHEGSRPDF